MISVDGPFHLDLGGSWGALVNRRWPVALTDGKVTFDIHSGAVKISVERSGSCEIEQKAADLDAFLGSHEATHHDVGTQPLGLGTVEGLGIYCASNSCLQPALREHRPPPLVARWVPLSNGLDVIISTAARHSIRERSGTVNVDLTAATTPVTIECRRCHATGLIATSLPVP